ncbi:MAG: hypothetical protein SGI83_05635 [Bacteroidota bacterium]|nr:hypothetical protein [Bacteroidota bacterium]
MLIRHYMLSGLLITCVCQVGKALPTDSLPNCISGMKNHIPAYLLRDMAIRANRGSS